MSGNRHLFLEGTVHGVWEALEYIGNRTYKCKCIICGAEKGIMTGHLRASKNKNCDKCRGLQIGSKFGEWEIIGILGAGFYKCKCSCGTIKDLWGYSFTSGKSSSCGCIIKSKSLDIVGKTIGKLYIKEATYPEGECNVRYLCDCACGRKNFIATRNNMTWGGVWHCGCEGGSYAEKELDILFPGALRNQRILRNHDGGLLEIDLLFENKKIGIEFNGDYWHSTQNGTGKNYHWYKTQLAHQQGIRLIHIFEYEWRFKKEIIINYLKNVLTRQDVLYEKDCVIRELSTKETRVLEENNNLHGSALSSIRIALCRNEDIYGLMTFGASRYDKTFQYELIRLTYSDTHVVGGTEKMFEYFIKNYTPESIVVYCDRAKFTGNSYKRLGFTFSEHTIPEYTWVHRNEVLNKTMTQKHCLIQKELGKDDMTEDEIMESRNYKKVYDCGNDKYIWGKENS